MTFNLCEATLSTGTVKYRKAGTGRPLLYLHSGEGPLVSKPLEDLAEQFQVFAPVAPGFENSPKIDQISRVEELAKYWAGFIDEVIGEPKVDIIGNSFGAHTAAWLTVSFPEKVDQVALIAPLGFNTASEKILSQDPKERLEQLYKYPERATNSGVLPSEMGIQVLPDYTSLAFDKDLLERMVELDKLMLILIGTEDSIVLPEVGQLLKERLKRAHFIYVYDAAHGIEVDQPERLAKVLVDFFARGEAFIVNWGGRAEEEAPTRDQA